MGLDPGPGRTSPVATPPNRFDGGLDLQRDQTDDAVVLQDRLSGGVQACGIEDFFALFAFVEPADVDQGLLEALIKASALLGGQGDRPHHQALFGPRHRPTVHPVFQGNGHGIAFGEQFRGGPRPPRGS